MESKLEEAKRLLTERGIDPQEYKHLDYYAILALAGVDPEGTAPVYSPIQQELRGMEGSQIMVKGQPFLVRTVTWDGSLILDAGDFYTWLDPHDGWAGQEVIALDRPYMIAAVTVDGGLILELPSVYESDDSIHTD